MPERILEPLGLVTGPAAFASIRSGQALPFQGGPAGFLLTRLIEGGADRGVVPVTAIPPEWQALLPPITAALPRFAGLVPRLPGGPLVMGIVNVTPDSFSGDGVEAEAAILRGRALLEAGADILDIGGESTRPGAAPVAPEEEIRRILPVVRALAPLAPVSIDTRNAATMAAALAAGASIINDIAALRHDPDAPRVVAEAGASVVLMHMLGTDPRTMQADPRYADVALEVLYFLRDRIQALGLPPERVAMDPGIGFGKTLAHNLMLLDRLPLLAGLGCPILVGASRKASLGRLGGVAEAGKRLAPSLAAALAATARGAAILRVHDVAETVQALRVWLAATTNSVAKMQA
ncbi:dihydropteroate synthase [Siccirubricoccus deserti]|uniref:dihydropteroate synthase n=1 Tax=Siccirubricoccus deserti TaxID=2013562 RepID=A0A9X0QYE6_9PROT|nr:dihydropteroate synthase [Siccirubricoccus deserti]MBC4015183.1 dihydropteroate synthase [Siccirubricoccus deserti]GGC38315.1 dihydropteroate synthase [Siccirubricoccus deserti]